MITELVWKQHKILKCIARRDIKQIRIQTGYQYKAAKLEVSNSYVVGLSRNHIDFTLKAADSARSSNFFSGDIKI